MLTTKHLCLVSLIAASFVAVAPAAAQRAANEKGIILQKRTTAHLGAIGDPGITPVAKRSGSPRAIQDVNERSKRAFNPQPDPPGKGAIQDVNDRRRKVLPFKSKNVKQSNPIGTKQSNPIGTKLHRKRRS